MLGILKKRFGFGNNDRDKLCLVKTALFCGECLYSGTRTGMRTICRKCGKYKENGGNGDGIK